MFYLFILIIKLKNFYNYTNIAMSLVYISYFKFREKVNYLSGFCHEP